MNGVRVLTDKSDIRGDRVQCRLHRDRISPHAWEWRRTLLSQLFVEAYVIDVLRDSYFGDK